MPDFSSSLKATGAFQAATLVLELRGSESECRFLRGGTAWDSRSFSHRLNPHSFLQPEVVGTYLPGTGTLGWGAWCGPGTPCSWDIPLDLYSPHLSIRPACSMSLFFLPVTVLLFSSMSDGFERWLFYSLVVILMWLWEDMSRVYLYCHLTGSQPLLFILNIIFLVVRNSGW